MKRRYFTEHRLLTQIIEYLIGGGVFFITGYAIFALCYSGFGLNWLIAKMIGDGVGWSTNYIVQRYWAFNSKRLYSMEGIVRRRYVILSLIDFAIDYALVASLKAYGITPYIGFFVSALFFTGWNFYWYKYWVFSTRKKPKLL